MNPTIAGLAVWPSVTCRDYAPGGRLPRPFAQAARLLKGFGLRQKKRLLVSAESWPRSSTKISPDLPRAPQLSG